MAGSSIDASSGCSVGLTFDHLTYTAGAFFRLCSRARTTRTLWDHNRHEGDISGGSGRAERVVANGDGPSLPLGLIVSNSLFKGGCADGFNLAGDPYGVQVGPGNEFTGLNQSGCTAHVDAIQGLGGRHTTVIGNWFHDNDFSGGFLQSCCSSDLLVINNVFANVAYHDSLSMRNPRSHYVHNVIRKNVGFGQAGECGSGVQVIRDNVFVSGKVTPSSTADL